MYFQFNDSNSSKSIIPNSILSEWELELITIEEGKASFAFNSGYSAIISTFITLFDGTHNHIVSSNKINNETYDILNRLSSEFGIKTTFVNISNLEEVKTSITEDTFCLYAESLSSLDCTLASLEDLSMIALQNNIPLVVDSTLTPPVILRCSDYADILCIDTSKYYNGHTTDSSGAVIDTGRFDWSNIKFKNTFTSEELEQDDPFISKLRTHTAKEEGNLIIPKVAYDLIILSKTLNIRVREQSRISRALIRYLEMEGYKVLKSHQSLLSGAIFYIDLGSYDRASKFIELCEKYKFALNHTYSCLVYTMVTHISNIFYSQLYKEFLEERSGVVRISIGIEDGDLLLQKLDLVINELKYI